MFTKSYIVSQLALFFSDVWGFILSHGLSWLLAHWGFLIQSRVGLLILWVAKEVTPLATAHLFKFLGWDRPCVIPNELSHGHPNLLTNLKKRLDHVLVQWSWSQSSLCWHFTHIFHIHGTLYASDSISETMIDCWLLGCPLVHISSYCLISHLYGATLPLSPFPWQRLHLLLYPFRKMFALFYWWLRGI